MESKNTWMTLFCTLIFFRSSFAQPSPAFERTRQVILCADSLIINNQTDQYINQFKKEISTNSSGNNIDVMCYNLAVCYSAKIQTDSTCYFLNKCLNKSSNYHNLILTDTDFDFLHQTPCWDKIRNNIDSVYLSQNSGITNKALAVELYHIFLKDQHVRGLGLKKIAKDLAHVDQENLKRVEAIIQEYGWPTYSMVGKTSADGAFLVIQHADVAVQRKYIMALMNAATKEEASKESVALLIDRISVQLKGMQIFGTQVYQLKDSVTGKPGGQYYYFPIKDEANVDSLRREMGLIPLQQYYTRFEIDYTPKAK